MLPMIGTFEGTVVGVAPASIHGDVYFDVLLWPAGSAVPEEESAIRAGAVHARVPSHLVGGMTGGPKAGVRLRLKMLLGQVNGVEVVG
jgi:hypothetical protein